MSVKGNNHYKRNVDRLMTIIANLIGDGTGPKLIVDFKSN